MRLLRFAVVALGAAAVTGSALAAGMGRALPETGAFAVSPSGGSSAATGAVGSAAGAGATAAGRALASRSTSSGISAGAQAAAQGATALTSTGPAVEHYPWGVAIPMSVAGPSWFDADLYKRVVAAGSRGVPLTDVAALQGKGGNGGSSGKGGGGGGGGGAATTAGCMASQGGAPTSSTVPTTPDGVERPPVGIGPGTWLISLFCDSIGGVTVPDGFAWCTANFVFKNGTSFGLGTAGHCAAKDALASPVTAVVQPPPEVCANGGSCAPGLYAIGTFSTVHNNGLGDDFAMISIYPQFNSWMRPTMPVFGGPTGSYISGLVGVQGQSISAAGNTVNLPAYYPAALGQCGHGLVVGTGGTCRVHDGLFAASTWYAWYGPSFEGDSGSGVEILGNYSSPLNAVPAAADLTHIIILDATVNRNLGITEGPDQPGMVGGTQMSKILSMIGSWQLVTSIP